MDRVRADGRGTGGNVYGGNMNWLRHDPDWLDSECGRFKIARLLTFHGKQYCAYDWQPADGWSMPLPLGVDADLEKVKALCVERS